MTLWPALALLESEVFDVTMGDNTWHFAAAHCVYKVVPQLAWKPFEAVQVLRVNTSGALTRCEACRLLLWRRRPLASAHTARAATKVFNGHEGGARE